MQKYCKKIAKILQKFCKKIKEGGGAGHLGVLASEIRGPCQGPPPPTRPELYVFGMPRPVTTLHKVWLPNVNCNVVEFVDWNSR